MRYALGFIICMVGAIALSNILHPDNAVYTEYTCEDVANEFPDVIVTDLGDGTCTGRYE